MAADETREEVVTESLEDGPELGPLPRLVRIPGGVPEIDTAVDEALAASKVEGTVRLRMQPDLYFHRGLTRRQRYDPWPGVNWVVDLTPEQAKEFRRDLDTWVQDWVQGKLGGV